jgi:hypothetical protein
LGETPHFSVFSRGGFTVVVHRLKPGEIDNDLAETLAGELVRPGLVEVPDAFERCFAGVVVSSAESPEKAWRAFYENTLTGLEAAASGERGGSGPVSDFGRIYDRARRLVEGSTVLDVGTCFGFFPMFLRHVEPGLEITALDVSEPMADLARRVAKSVAKDVSFVHADARDLPFAGDSFDTVTALHVLEHLPEPDGERVLGAMCRTARRRVVVAVPLEEEPDPAFGHVRSFDRASLLALAEETGWRCEFEEYLGGWIFLEPGPRSVRE